MAAIHYKPGKFRYTQTFALERRCEDKQPHGGMVNQQPGNAKDAGKWQT